MISYGLIFKMICDTPVTNPGFPSIQISHFDVTDVRGNALRRENKATNASYIHTLTTYIIVASNPHELHFL